MVARRVLVADDGELRDGATAGEVLDFGGPARRVFELTDDPTGRGGLRYLPDGGTGTTLPTQTYALQWDSLFVSDVPGGAPFGNDTAPALVGAIGECRFDDPGGLFSSALLFNQGTTLTANGVNVGPAYTMVNQPNVRTGALGGTRTFSQANAVRSQMSVGPNVAGNVVLTSHEAFFATMTVDATVGTATATIVNYFAAKAPTLTAGGTIGTLHCIDLEDIPAAGITNLRGIASAMNSGQFIRHTGTAPVQLGGALQLGVGSTFDWSISRAAADRADIASGDSLRIVNGSLQFVGTGGQIQSSVNGELQVTSTRLGFGIAPAGANWGFGFSTTARTITVAGDFSNFLNTAGGSHTLNTGGPSINFWQWRVNAPTMGTITSGTVSEAGTMIIQGNVNVGTDRYGLRILSNPSGGTLNRSLRVAGISQFDAPIIVPSYTVAGLPSASPAAQVAYASDETGGAVLVFSDGANWRRVTDRAIAA